MRQQSLLCGQKTSPPHLSQHRSNDVRLSNRANAGYFDESTYLPYYFDPKPANAKRTAGSEITISTLSLRALISRESSHKSVGC